VVAPPAPTPPPPSGPPPSRSRTVYPAPDPALPVPPPLPPLLDGDLSRLATEHGLLHDLLDAFGSPLNVLLPAAVRTPVRAFRAVLTGHGVRHRLFLAHKANRSAAVIRQAAVDGLDLDVASPGELRNGLVNGFPGTRMEATGPKNPDFLRLAAQHGLLVHVDGAAELDQLAATAAAFVPGRTIDIVLRIALPASVAPPGAGGPPGTVPAGDSAPGRAIGPDTKFGLPPAEVPTVLARLAATPDPLRLRGFAFHLTSGGTRERVAAFETLVDFYLTALRAGLRPEVLNIGGGFPVRYLDDPATWARYTSALKEGLLGRGPALSWNGEGFGMAVRDGRVTGTARMPDFAVHEDGATQLDAFLSARMTRHGRRGIATFLAENDLELHLEPGRALLDQAGLTLARVSFTKFTATGQQLIGLDANRTALDSTDREFFADPLLLPRPDTPDDPDDPADQDGPVGVYLGGNLCHPADLITRHLTRLDRLPRPGEALAFVNTAAYAMDFAESATLLQRTGAKVALDHRDGRWRWWRDEDYPPAPAGTPETAGAPETAGEGDLP
jgi:diaminopimelate decarboxylase